MLSTLSSLNGEITPIKDAVVAVGPSGAFAALNRHGVTLGSVTGMSRPRRVSWICLMITEFCLPGRLIPEIAPALLSGPEP
jgi:hypothetical protein